MQSKLSSVLSANEIVALFNGCFALPSKNEATPCLHTFANRAEKPKLSESPTFLIPMADEPIYLPAHHKPQDHFVELKALNASRTNKECNDPHLNDTGKIVWLGDCSLRDLPEGNKIFFNRDYVASALHEVAHWCIAGEARRQQVDYGYWYTPDTRNAQQQAQFEKVEIKPQAVEWGLSLACGKAFKVSSDNLLLQKLDVKRFEKAVHKQLRHYQQFGFPERAQIFITVLREFYAKQNKLTTC